MKNYLSLLGRIFNDGRKKTNRTGIDTKSLTGEIIRYDLSEGFPALTTRQIPFKNGRGELVGFLRGVQSAADFRDLGCNVWTQNANEEKNWLNNPYRKGEDDLGPVYGAQWRRWPAYKEISEDQPEALQDALSKGYEIIASREVAGKKVDILFKEIDQVKECLDKVVYDPDSRRILFHAWNPAKLDEMALPPCHLLYQFDVDRDNKELSLIIYLRSNDLPLGNPLNLIEGAMLLTLFGRLSGYKPKNVIMMMADAHIYANQEEMIQEQLKRVPLDLPTLVLSDRIPDYAETGVYEPEWLDKVEPEDFEMVGYKNHGKLTAPMAV